MVGVTDFGRGSVHAYHTDAEQARRHTRQRRDVVCNRALAVAAVSLAGFRNKRAYALRIRQPARRDGGGPGRLVDIQLRMHVLLLYLLGRCQLPTISCPGGARSAGTRQHLSRATGSDRCRSLLCPSPPGSEVGLRADHRRSQHVLLLIEEASQDGTDRSTQLGHHHGGNHPANQQEQRGYPGLEGCRHVARKLAVIGTSFLLAEGRALVRAMSNTERPAVLQPGRLWRCNSGASGVGPSQASEPHHPIHRRVRHSRPAR